MTVFYRLNGQRAVHSIELENRNEFTQWLACMAQEGRFVHVLRTETL